MPFAIRAEDECCCGRHGCPTMGAYEHTSATNPGWDPGEGFKSETPVTAETDVPNPRRRSTRSRQRLGVLRRAKRPGSSVWLAGLVRHGATSPPRRR